VSSFNNAYIFNLRTPFLKMHLAYRTTPSTSNGALTNDVIAGIAISINVGATAFAASIWAFWRRRRKSARIILDLPGIRSRPMLHIEHARHKIGTPPRSMGDAFGQDRWHQSMLQQQRKCVLPVVPAVAFCLSSPVLGLNSSSISYARSIVLGDHGIYSLSRI
jgi:hypothetical protein